MTPHNWLGKYQTFTCRVTHCRCFQGFFQNIGLEETLYHILDGYTVVSGPYRFQSFKARWILLCPTHF